MKNPNNYNPRAKALLVAFATLTIIAATAPAQTTIWQPAGSGDWNVGGNWDIGVPTAATAQARIPQGEAVLSGAGIAQRVMLGIGGTGGTLRLEAGADLDATSRLEVGWAGSGAGTFIQNGGTTNANDLRMDSAGSTVTINDGTFTAAGKSFLSVGTPTDKTQTISVTGGSFTVQGNLVASRNGGSGVLEVSGGSVDIQGILSREGTLNNKGEFRVIGSAASSINIGNDILVDALDTMAFSLDSGGITPITVGDEADLPGVGFELDTIAGFSASIGDTFELLDAGSIVNIDASPTVTNLGGYSFDVSTVADGAGTDLIATVTAIPEPTAAGLFAVAGALLLFRRRRFHG